MVAKSRETGEAISIDDKIQKMRLSLSNDIFL